MTGSTIAGAARLDPASGLIVGVARAGRRPPPVEIVADGRIVRRILAAARLVDLPETARAFADVDLDGDEAAFFAVRLPRNAVGSEIMVRSGGARLLDARWRDAKEMRRYMEGSVMSDSMTLEELSFRFGVFSGRLRDHAPGGAPPRLRMYVRDQEVLGEVELAAEGDGVYAFTAELPPASLGEGVLAIQFRVDDGSVVGVYQIAAGAALVDDLAAEVGSLRAELDQLKRAFRDTFAAGALRRDERPMIVAEALAQVDHLLEMRDRMDRRQDALAAAELVADDDADWDVDQ